MGTNSFISKVTPLGSATTYTIKDPIMQETIIGTQTGQTGSWTGKSNYINALYDGLTIRYYLPYAPSGNATLNLTLADGTTTGAINCYYGGNTRLTTHYGVGNVIELTYFSAGSVSVGGTATTDNRWYAKANYVDGNDVNVSRITYPRLKTGAVGIGRYTLFMEASDGTYQSLTSTFNSTGTSHVKNTAKFKLGRIYYRNRSDDLAANNSSDTNNSWMDQQTSLVDLRYSTNCGTTLVARKPIYIVGTVGTDGYFTLADTWYSQTEPTSEDGKVYIYLGMVYNDTNPYRVAFEVENPVYWYKNSGFRLYGSGRGISNITRSGTTFTATRDDGSTFTFSQQDSNTTSFTITANATDGIWDLTGTNGTNAVTYAVAPYSAQQSKASFDTSSTNPTRTDRLNYNGYLYATKLYSGGAEVLTSHQSLSGYIPKSTLSGAYDIMYSSAANTPTRLAANTTTTKKFLRMTGTGSAGAAPAWDTVTKSDVGLGNVENTALSTWAGSSNITTIGTLSSGTVPWARLSNVPNASTSTAGIIQIGSGASNAAAGNHTHTTSIATDSGTNQITLALGTKYKLTAGGTSYIFTMPSNPNTDTTVTQTNTTATNDYRVLLSGSANDTTEDTTSNKNTNLRFNPGTQLLSVGGSISATGDLDITGNATFNGETSVDSLTAGSLLVNGATSFVQIPTAPTPATTSNDTSVATTAFVKNNLGGLSGAMHFKGTTTTAMSDGLTTAAVTIGGSSYTPSAGDVVLYSDSEFVWTGSAWERLGRDSSFKTTQTAVTTATTASTTTTTTFVSKIEQDANGVIKYTTQPLPTYNNYSHPTTTSASAAAVKVGRDTLGHVVLGNAITYSDVGAASAAHAHGNITNDGKVGSTADYALHTTTGGAVTASSFAVTSPSASGSTTAFIDTVSQDSKGKISATKKNITAATTSTAGIMAMSNANINTMLNQLTTGSSDPADNDYYISQYVNGGSTTTTYHRRPMSNLYNYIKTKLNVTNNTVNLSYNTESTIATIGGTAIKVKLPASDNTDTKNTAGSTNSTSKLFLIGATAQSANPQTYSNSAVYAQAGAFAATSVKVAEKVTLQYNSTTNALDFIFA